MLRIERAERLESLYLNTLSELIQNRNGIGEAMAEVETANQSAVVVRQALSAPAERVFRAWTDAAQYKSND